MRFDEDERVESCQREIQRLRGVVRGLQDELNRYQTIAHNAIILLEEANCGDFHEVLLDELGIDESEYHIIMED